MKGTGAKRNVCPGSCVSTGAKFPVAPVESAPMSGPYVIFKITWDTTTTRTAWQCRYQKGNNQSGKGKWATLHNRV